MTAPAPAKIALPVVADDDDADRVSRFELERFVCGELSAERRAHIERALAADPALKAVHDDVIAADKAFLIELPPAPFFARHEQAPSLWTRLLSHWQAGFGAAAAAAAVVVLVVVNTTPADDGNRSKGGPPVVIGPRVSFFVKQDGAARVGSAGEELRAGDQIQLAVKDIDKQALVVVGVDGGGAVTVYASESVQGVVSKGPLNGPPRVLPASLLLDDSTGPERFFVVYGDDVDALLREVQAAADRLGDDVKAGRKSLLSAERLPLDEALPQASIHIVKVR